jgi:hypothetical protein
VVSSSSCCEVMMSTPMHTLLESAVGTGQVW